MSGIPLKDEDDEDDPETGTGAIIKSFLQVSPFFFLAGMGMVASGALLSFVSQNMMVFKEVPSLLILVPALLGLKGNLEMTLGARLGSHANKKELQGATFWPIVRNNLLAIQCQAIIVGSAASVLAIGEEYTTTRVWHSDQALLLAASAITAASLASLLLASLMIVIVVIATKKDIDPDNITAPIAGMLGDFVTLGIVVLVARLYWALPRELFFCCLIGLLVAYGFLAVMCFSAAFTSKYTKEIMVYGWPPVIASMILSNLSGPISEAMITKHPTFARFQVVMNGAGGNLGAIFCCRMSTDLLVTKEEFRLKMRPPTLPSPYRGLVKRLSRMGHTRPSRNWEAATLSHPVSRLGDGSHTLAGRPGRSLTHDHVHEPGRTHRSLTEEAHMKIETSWVKMDDDEDYVSHFLSFKAILGEGDMSRFCRMLLLLILPGQAVFVCIVVGAASGWSALPSPLFLCCFICASFAQVMVLLMASRQLVVFFWRKRLDPDNGASPLICGLGDLFGTGFMALAYMMVSACGGEAWPGHL